MKTNYKGAIERINTVALAHPQVNSADDGRELEFDVNKANQFPRVFIKTVDSPIVGGEGSVDLSVNFDILVADRFKPDRSNVVDVMNLTHSVLTDILATLNKERLIRVSDGFALSPLYDYHDSQVGAWQTRIRVYLDQGFNCYPV